MQQATWSNLYNKFGHVAHMFMPVRLEIDMRGMQKYYGQLPSLRKRAARKWRHLTSFDPPKTEQRQTLANLQ